MHRNAQLVSDAAASAGLPIEIVEYAEEGARTADDAASAIGVQVGQIVKSLVFAVGDPSDKASGQPVVALVCGDDQLDVSLLATAAGQPGAWRIDAKAVREATGFAVGGIPPLGHAQQLPVFADHRLKRFGVVWAAAGTPSHVFGAEPVALATAAGATWADLATVSEPTTTGTDGAENTAGTSAAPTVESPTTGAGNGTARADAPLAVTHPRAEGRDILGTIPLTARPPKLSALPSVFARAIAFASILLGGAMGGTLTYGVMKVFTGKTTGATIGVWMILGAVGTALGVGVLATIALRAMGEWRSLNKSGTANTVLGNG